MLSIKIHGVSIFLILLLSASAFAQTETFDIITFTAPKGWTRVDKDGVRNYTMVNASNGTFCVIAMYPSVATTDGVQADFNKDWQALVVSPFDVKPDPKTEIETTPEGWKMATAAASVKQDGVDVYMILRVVSGFGRSLTFRISLNDQSYINEIDALFKSMKLEKNSKSSTIDESSGLSANSAKGRFGYMLYGAPGGWSEQKFSDGIVFKPLDLPAGEQLAIQIMQPMNYSGDLEQALAMSFEEATLMYHATSMYQAGGKYSKNTSRKSFKGWEYIRGRGAIMSESGGELGLELFIIKINNRFERIAILESRKYCGGVSLYYATDRIQYRNDIEDLLFSLHFSDFNAVSLEPGNANGTGITGVWQGTIQSTGAATGVRLEVFSPVFFSNGQVYFGSHFPIEGLDQLNSRIPPELHPRDWGTYTFNNGNGVLQMPFANIPFRIEGKKLFVTKNQRDWPFYKLNSVDGARFNGTYKMSESYGINPSIVFTSDGRFADNGVIRVLYHDNTTCINPGFIAGSGNYEVKNHSVIFNYSDGRKVKFAFLGTDYDKANPSPATLRMSFNDDPLFR